MGRTVRRMTKDDLADSPERVAAVQGLRRSNASGPMADRRTRRVRTRSAARTAAIQAAA